MRRARVTARLSGAVSPAPTPLALFAALALGACSGGAPGPAGPGTEAVGLADLGDARRVGSVRATPVTISTEPWEFTGRPGLVIRTPHYRIYTTERDEAMRARMASFLEHAIAQYRAGVAPLPAPTMKLDVYFMDNRAQWETLTKRLMGVSAGGLGNIERGGFAARGIGVYYDLGLHDTFAIAAHEGWHQYTQRVFRDPLPVWLEEGMATYMEGHRWSHGPGEGPRFLPWANMERFDRLREAIGAGREIPLGRLLGMRPQDELGLGGDGLLDYYAHVWALTHFLEEGEGGRYRTPFRAMLTDAADGKMRKVLLDRLGPDGARATLTRRVGDGAFRAYFGSEIDPAARAFHEFLHELVRTGARDAIAQGRSPFG